MKNKYAFLTLALLFFSLASVTDGLSASVGKKTLRISCSAQIAEAIGPKGFHAFEQASGIELETYICSSEAAIYRLMHGHSDMAGTSQGIPYTQGVWGYVETPICTDPIAVIVNKKLPIQDLTVYQLRMIFSGQVMNWKTLGGADRDIMVVIPATETAAYKNFERRAMRYKPIRYDLMAYKSTHIIPVVAKFSNAVSFISQGAAAGKPSIRSIKVGHRSIKEKDYPFQQVFSFVTKGLPKANNKVFIDYWRSQNGLIILQEKGMNPILK